MQRRWARADGTQLSDHHYEAFGLSIACNAPIPGLPSAADTDSPDLYVLMGDDSRDEGPIPESVSYLSPTRDDSGTPLLTVWTRPGGGHRLRYCDGAEYTVDHCASRVHVRWEAPLSSADAAIYLLGPVLGFVMRLRGIVPLHASAVAVGGRAIVFAGDAGMGKSTTAVAFAALGYPVLSDDVVPIVLTENGVLAYPSHPRLTIWPESVEGLFGSAAALPALTATYDKRYLDLVGRFRFQSTPLPIEVIYVLSGRAQSPASFGVRTLKPPAALLTLVGHTYGNYLLDGPMRASEFDCVSQVAQRIPVRELTLGAGLSELPRVCEELVTKGPREAAATTP